MKSKAFVDTTVLADRLIKSGVERSNAKAALEKYEVTELPVYAIKEFKAGALDYVKYLHNKLITTGTVADTLIALSRIGRQANRQQTALRTIGDLMKKANSLSASKTLKAQYGKLAEEESISYDAIRYEAKLLVFKAWKKRRSITTNVIQPLSCYNETAPLERKDGQLSLVPRECNEDDCCLTKELRARKFKLTKLTVAIDNLPENLRNKLENQKRRKILREVSSRPSRKLSDSDCRNLGDAIFAVFCPDDADILTTNIQDHKPLADALNKTAVSPESILK
jgi:hypothetical protein